MEWPRAFAELLHAWYWWQVALDSSVDSPTNHHVQHEKLLTKITLEFLPKGPRPVIAVDDLDLNRSSSQGAPDLIHLEAGFRPQQQQKKLD